MNGILNLFLSVIGVLMKPGEIKETLTLYFLKSKKRLSARLIKAAFEGPYPVELGSPLYPATEETIEICPFYFSLKYFSTAFIQFKVPKKFTFIVFLICSKFISFSVLGS